MIEQPPAEAVILRALKELVAMESDRDKQRMIGPSDMADPCARCLAFKMAGTPIKRNDHTLFAWMGTGIHLHLEKRIEILKELEDDQVPANARFARDFFASALTEVKVPVCTIPGYGTVYGHIDMLGGIPVDWKSITIKRLTAYRTDLSKGKVPLGLQRNASQLTLYLGAARRLGYNAGTGVLAFIPRDAVTDDDFWTYPVQYSEQNEQALIQRTVNIYQYVKAQRHDEIPSDPECYTCHPRYYAR